MPHTRRLHLENRPIARSIIARRDDEGEKHEARAAVPQPPRVLPAGAAPSRGAPERTKRLGLQSRVERDEKESARSTARVRRQVVPAANAHALENRCEEARRSAREFPDACAENAHCARSAASVQRRCVLQSTSPAMCSPHAQPIKKHELRAEIEQLQNVGFVPVGITNASEDVKQLAAAMNLPYFISTRLHVSQDHSASYDPQDTDQSQRSHQDFQTTEDVVENPIQTSASSPEHSVSAQQPQQEASSSVDPPPAVSAESGLSPMVITASVRSGQQIFAQNRSLVILGNVNSGAEVLADEDVFVMGALKGRALAGIGGNVSARIICQSFDAELISIAHHFTTCDELDEQKHTTLRVHKPTIVSLHDDQLHFQSTH